MISLNGFAKGQVFAIIGLNWGSEGKGSIAEYFASLMSMGVRSGSANAGHTIYYRGKKFVMRQLPTTWINPYATLVIGRGSVISFDVLQQEVQQAEAHLPIRDRLYIDSKAHVITSSQIQREAMSDLGARIGSTSARSHEGIGEAMADKVLRSADCVQAKDFPELQNLGVVCDTVDLINIALDGGQFVLLEGTQGFGLSIEHGEFPFVTSRDTTVTSLAASVGIATHDVKIHVIGVTRTYPIRVAGNSGPFADDCKELEWGELTRLAGANEPLTEATTVTHLPRRVATFSESEFLRACQVNRPTEIALTFADYLDYSLHNQEYPVSDQLEMFRMRIEYLAKTAPVTLIKTGPQVITDYDDYRRRMIEKVG